MSTARTRRIEAALARGADHHRAGRFPEAAAAYVDALREDPDHLDALTLLGGALHRMGRPADALAVLDRAVARDPRHALAHLNRGRVLLALDRPDTALTAFDAALAARPGFRDAALGRARALHALGRADDALDALDGHDADPRLLADVRVAAGLRRLAEDPAAGVALLRRALAASDDTLPRTILADALFQHPALATRDDLDALFTDGVDAQRLARAAERLLADDVHTALPTPAAPTITLSPLARAWLHRAVVTSPTVRSDLRALGRAAMEAVLADRPVDLATLEALAAHAWNTEHADVDAPDEALADALAALPPTPARLAACAIARPLPTWPDLPTLDGTLAALVRQQIVDPAAERALAAALPALDAHADTTSAAVRAQYEENPYPRLVGFHRRAPVPFAAWLARYVDVPTPPARVLVAGAGTGQHPLGIASSLDGVEVIGLDLSRASLGRAARLAREHGLAHLRFVQGDLLALGDDDGLGTFGVVDCVGVLHHLADPLAGGRALLSKLAPGGVLRLGLYSERGRADVVAARALVAEHGWEPTPAGLRAARAAILALPSDHPAAGLAASVDLYSQSGLRDLVFHPCEHRYTPNGVAALVAALGLRVLALQHARPEPARLYAARWPDDPAQADLARWDTLEAEHPRLFAGMIHVWCGR